jgi:hypothetical protein
MTQQPHLLPVDSIATRAAWARVAMGWEIRDGDHGTGWILHDRHRQCRAIYPWALIHADGRYIRSPYALGWEHAAEARAAALRAYAGELQLYPASVLHWPSNGHPFTDCGHAITDVYILEEAE